MSETPSAKREKSGERPGDAALWFVDPTGRHGLSVTIFWVGIFLALAGVSGFIGAKFVQREIAMRTRGVIVNGSVTRVDTVYRRVGRPGVGSVSQNRLLPFFGFATPDGVAHVVKSQTTFTDQYPSALTTSGTPIRMVYDPKNPEWARPADGAFVPWLSVAALALLFLMPTMAAATYITSYRRGRSKKLASS